MDIASVVFVIVPICICLVFLMIGILLSSIFVQRRNYIPTIGQIVECRVCSDASVDRTRTLHSLFLVIQYDWKGKTYRKQPAMVGWHGQQTKRSYEQRAEALKAGLEIEIYCNPEKPEEYVLQKNISPWEIFALLCCYVVGLGGPTYLICKVVNL